MQTKNLLAQLRFLYDDEMKTNPHQPLLTQVVVSSVD